MPDRFAQKRKGSIGFDQGAPSRGNFRFVIELVGDDEEKQIGAAIAQQSFEFCAVVESLLQSGQLAQDSCITAVPDRGEIVRIEFRK